VGWGSNRGRLISCRGPGHPTRLGHKMKRKRRGAQACRSNSNEHELCVRKSCCCCQTPGSCRSHQSANIPDLEEDGKLVLSRTTSSVWSKISIQGRCTYSHDCTAEEFLKRLPLPSSPAEYAQLIMVPRCVTLCRKHRSRKCLEHLFHTAATGTPAS
jgi:hypothetical protein